MALNNPYSISLDGVDDYIRIPSNGNFLNDPSLTGQLTVEFWAKIESGHYIISSGTFTFYRGISISYQDGSRIINLADGTKLWTINEAHMILNEWHHYALVWDGITLTWLVDGEQKNQVTGIANSRGSVYSHTDIGKPANTSNYYCKFDLDELRVWDHARDLELIKYYKDRRLDPEKPGLAIHYSFDSGSGNIAYDLGPSAINATVYGATWISSEINLCLLNLDIVSDFRAKAHIGPKVETLPATDIGSKSMTLNGKLKGIANYAGAECSFQYYPVDQYQNKALNFNGGSHIRIPYESCLSPETITIEAFIEPSQLSGTQTILSQEYQWFNLDDYNTIIYVDAEKGNDLTGDGTQKFPFQTLTEAIKHHNGPTAFILGEGIYDSVNVNSAEYQEKLAFIGQGRDTTFKIKGTLTAGSDGSTVKLTADLYFYNLVWDGNNLGGVNYMRLGKYSSWRFYNVVFTNIKDCDYGYFLITQPGLVLSFENCIKTAPSKDFLRHSEDADVPGIIKNCYGAWSDWGYDTTESDFIITTTIMTDTPQLDTDYNILDEGWQNAGTGTNPDGTQAHIGVYGGLYAWNYLGYFLKLAGSRVEFGCTTDSVSRLFSQHEISEGETVHVACTYDKIGMRIYINGNLDSFMPKNGNLFAFSAPLYIAKNFNGTIDEIRIWNRARTQKEIEECIYQELTGAEEGLIAYYRFNEGEGDIIYDCSANYNDVTINNALWVDSPFKLMPPKEKLEIVEGTKEEKVLMPTPLQATPPQKIYSPYTLVKTVTPKEVNGLYFDGVDDYISIPYNAITRPERLTIMAWAEKDDWTENNPVDKTGQIISCHQSGGYALLVMPNGTVSFQPYINGDYRVATTSSPPTKGTHFICGTYDGQYIRLYIDGELAAETTYSGSISYAYNNALMIGANPDSTTGTDAGYFFEGSVSHVSIWNRALTAGEVKYYYNNNLEGDEHGLVAYYKIDEGESNKVYNSSLYKSEYNLDGTIYGATWDIVSLPETRYEYQPGAKFSSIITPGEYKPISDVIKGLRFDGVDDHVLFGNDSIFRSNLTSITIEAIVKPEKVSGHSFIFDVGVYADKGYGLSIADSLVTFHTPTAYGGISLRSTTNINTGSIYYVTCVLDGERDLMKIYINGVLESQVAVSPSLVLNSTTVTTDNGATRARIGSQAKEPYRSERFFKGELYQFRFWNRALSDEEIAFYYNKRITQDFPGLVINYSFDKDVGGNVLVDSSTSYNHGAIYGAQRIDADVPLYSIDIEPSGTRYYYRAVAKGLPDYALGFNGSNTYAEISSSPIFDFAGNNFTIIMKINPKWHNDWIPLVVKRADHSVKNDRGFWKNIGTDGDEILLIYGNNTKLKFSTTMQNIPSGHISTIAFVRNGKDLHLYINGRLDSTINVSGVSFGYNSDIPIKIGGANHPALYKNTFDGYIYNVQFWGRALSQEEIEQNQNIPLVGNESGLIAYYRMVEGEGDTLVDHSINQNHGTIYGATWVQL